MRTLDDLLVRSVAAGGDRPALQYRSQMMTYRQLASSVEGFAAGLASLGISRGARIGLLLPNCPPFVIAYLGASRVGAVVPMNVLYRPDEARHILADSEAEVLVTAEPFRPLVQAIRDELPKLKHVVMASEDEPQTGEIAFHSLCAHRPAALDPVSKQDIAAIIYTSGTTGRPKGAMLTHANLLANAVSCAEVLPVGPDDCFLSALPLFHSFAAMVFMILPILAGGRIQLMERFLPSATLSLLEQAGGTVFGGVPSMFTMMLQVSERPQLPSLRISVSGGAALPPEVWHAFEQAFDTRLIEGYGLTEASPVVAANPPFGLRKPGSVGPPLPGVEVKIVGCDGCSAPEGEVGELAIRGGNVMAGYLNRPDETAEAIRDGWLFTGDLARLDEDGYLCIAGRKKELIIVGGLNVYPGEVERVLVEHSAVLEAAAFGVDDKARGEAVWAAVVLNPEQEVSESDLRAFCRERLANFKVPRGIEICESLPKNALGKVIAHVLRENLAGRW
jgi:long-chain acyl-CoA synthetase